MNRTSFLTAVISVFLLHSVAFAQSQDLPKFESENKAREGLEWGHAYGSKMG